MSARNEPAIVVTTTLDDKIGKVIEEIKQLNREKAAKFGIKPQNPSSGVVQGKQMNLADATFNDRDELSALFEKRPNSATRKRLFNHLTTESDERGASSYESYRS